MVWFGLEGRNTPRIKKFLANAKIGLTPETLWSGDNFGTTDSAKKHLLSLFPEMENVFDTPKPEELIKQIIEIASNEGEYVLDCYKIDKIDIYGAICPILHKISS